MKFRKGTILELMIIIIVMAVIITQIVTTLSKKENLQIKQEQQATIEHKVETKVDSKIIENTKKEIKVDSNYSKEKETKFFVDENNNNTQNNKELKEKTFGNLLFTIFIGMVSVIGLLFFGQSMIWFYDKYLIEKNRKKDQKLEEEYNLKFDLNKYKYDLKYSEKELNKLNEIDKNLMKDIYEIINDEKNIDFVKNQVKDLYKNSYSILKQLEDLIYVVEKFKNNLSKINNSKDEEKLLKDNEIKINELNQKYKTNLSTYNFILLQLPKLNNEENIDTVSNDIKQLISNVIYLNQPNKDVDNLLNKYTK